jgi:hypothetical protein
LTLPARLVAGARAATILATTGLEAETALSFAALGDLLRPLLPRLSTLPPTAGRDARRPLGPDAERARPRG